MYGNTETLDGGYAGAGLTLGAEDTANLRKAGKWARFLGIVSMVAIGIFILVMILFGGTFLAASGMGGEFSAAGSGAVTIAIVFYGAIFAFTFYLMYLIYNFGAKAVNAVDVGNQAAMTQSLFSLGRFFKIYGILTIIYLVFVLLGVLIMVIGGAAALMGT